MDTYTYEDEYVVKLRTLEMKGCCGILVGYGLEVRDYNNGHLITDEQYKKLDHIKFIKRFESEVLEHVEIQSYTRIIISDVVPNKIVNAGNAYYNFNAPHNKAINLYTILTDLKWEGAGKSFVNERTKNLVKVFYKDLEEDE
jgi:hypothetical protein